MMGITERQKQILECIVSEYIDVAKPVSSQAIEEKYDFGVSPATLRNEMLELSEQGFLRKPHASSGRVPTDKGYRFFVDEISQKKGKKYGLRGAQDSSEEEWVDPLDFAWHVAKTMALESSNLGAVYMPHEEIFWKEGWEELLKEPEFEDKKYVQSFTRFIRDFEEQIERLKLEDEMQIFIGKENPFSNVNDFSIMITECVLPEGEKAMIALLGPKRMAYSKNIGIITQWNKQK